MSTAVLPESVNHASANACVSLLVAAVSRAANSPNPIVVVDASAVQRFDSSALAVLLQARRDALAVGKTLHVIGWPTSLERLARLYDVHQLLAA